MMVRLQRLSARLPQAMAVVITTVQVDIPSIPAGGSVTITFDVVVADPFPVGPTQVCNQGSGDASNFPGPVGTDNDTNPGNGINPTCTTITAGPNFDIQKTVLSFTGGDGNLNPGERITYNVRIENTGNQTAVGVVFVDDVTAVDPNLTYVLGSYVGPGAPPASETR